MNFPTLSSLAPVLAGLWCVLAFIWLRALTPTIKVRWMHYLHALLPVAAIAAWYGLPADAPLVSYLGRWLMAGAFILAFLTLVWLFTLYTRNAGVMDVVYTPSAWLPVLAVAWAGHQLTDRALLLIGLMVVWSVRLVRHASRTNLGARGEQQPYASWRQKFGGNWWWWSFFQVFALQGGIVWIWIMPAVFVLDLPASAWGLLDLAGVLVWLTGLTFQAGADWHLERFKANPANKGKVLQSGLWSLSRHPNYFGESVMWWGLFVLSLSHPWAWLGIVGPVYVTWFMSRGSAATMLDRHMLRTKPDYADYVRRVPGFCPLYKSPRDEKLLERAGAAAR